MPLPLTTEPLFNTGKLLCTVGVVRQIPQEVALHALNRHLHGDWGNDLCDEDRRTNAMALITGARLMSSYKHEGIEFWIITEAANDEGKRPSTTILLPSEY